MDICVEYYSRHKSYLHKIYVMSIIMPHLHIDMFVLANQTPSSVELNVNSLEVLDEPDMLCLVTCQGLPL